MINTLQYITQSSSEESILSEVKAVLEAGITWVQLRIKEESLDYLRIAKQVKVLTDKAESVLIINDRVDIAIEVDAHGVHVGLTDMPIKEVRALIGKDKIIGGTANTFVDAKNAELFGADYIGLGPFKHTTTKRVLSPVLGLEGYKQIIPKTEPYGWQTLTFNIPIIAIGGLEMRDIEELKEETGVYGIALSGLIYNSKKKQVLISHLNQILN
jgi:thiamine-phosphate pyrophosphorylase